jgi:transketolase C-terminal domain/subunit
MTQEYPHYVQDGIYSEVETDRLYRLLGLKSKVVVMQADDSSEYLEVSYAEFQERFTDTGVHNHRYFVKFNAG